MEYNGSGTWVEGRNIYITNDEEIKERDWFTDSNNSLKKNYKLSHVQFANPKKIILTTDQDLIKDGVQAIDDEFLEWFVKNPTCEFVDIESYKIDKEWDEKHTQFNPIYPVKNKYKINIPQEEQQDKNMYSEEQVLGKIKLFARMLKLNYNVAINFEKIAEEWFEKIKNK
jgi:hypothetical protein